jgi:hypothetical protein
MATNRTTNPDAEIVAIMRQIGQLKQGSHAAGLRGNTRDQFRNRRTISLLRKRLDALTAAAERAGRIH